MGGKYSAEWWEKITGLNREILAPDVRSSVIDDLIQATASSRPSPERKSETSERDIRRP
jgi:hypothetical protein